MATVCAALATLAFFALLIVLKVVERAGQSLATMRRALADLKAASTDEARERISQQASLAAARLFLAITASVLAAAAAPLALVYGLDRLALVSFDAVVAVMASPVFILASVAVGLAAWLATRRLRRTPAP